MRKIIYFVAEAEVDGEIIQSEKFNQLVNPKINETIFDDVFQITDCKDFLNYRNKEDFINAIYEMAYSYFSMYGDDIKNLMIIAADGKTDILQWGVKINLLDDEKFEYSVMDWKADKHIFKFGE